MSRAGTPSEVRMAKRLSRVQGVNEVDLSRSVVELEKERDGLVAEKGAFEEEQV